MDPHWPASSALPPHLRPALGAARLRAHWDDQGLVHALGVREPVPRGLIKRNGDDVFIAGFHQSVQLRGPEGLMPAPANALVAWRPGMAQEYGRDDAAWMHSWLHLRDPFASALLAAAGLPIGLPLAMPSLDGFEAALIDLHREQAAEPRDQVVVEALVVVLLRRLARHAAPPMDGLEAVRQAIIRQPGSRHRLGELAELAACSPQHLCRAFRGRFGTTPLAFAAGMRLEQAARLLSAGCAPTLVANQCGWADPRQFARVFRARFGCTPAGWRQRT